MEERDNTQKSKRSSSNRSTFKIGVIALVFLILGFQIALFVVRASRLRIEAVRDKPDTVYVVRYLGDNPTEGPSESKGSHPANRPSGISAARRTASRDHAETLKRTAPHSPLVEKVRAESRRVESFPFNPNTVSLEDLQRLGFTAKQAKAIDNYRLKGGRFSRRSDFARSFVVSDSVYQRLEGYIEIPLLDINEADSAAFDALPGIGPYFAAKMVAYRKKIGLYSSCGQLLDIHNFGQERFEGIKDLIFCGEHGISPSRMSR